MAFAIEVVQNMEGDYKTVMSIHCYHISEEPSYFFSALRVGRFGRSAPVLYDVSVEVEMLMTFYELNEKGQPSGVPDVPGTVPCSFGGDGGGMYNTYGASPQLTECEFTDNEAAENGGGMANDDASPVLTGCTFAGNSASFRCGGIYSQNSVSPSLINCIVWGNTSQQIYLYDGTVSITITFSDLQGGQEMEQSKTM